MDAVIRRTKEELGLDISSYADELKEVGRFHYYKKYSTCAENEIDHVFLLTMEKQPILDVEPDEIAEVQWESIDAIAKELGKNFPRYLIFVEFFFYILPSPDQHILLKKSASDPGCKQSETGCSI